MKKIIPFLLIISTLVAFSCDGQGYVKDLKQESIAKNKEIIQIPKLENYSPESYVEVKTDSILDNGMYITINYHSNLDKNLPKKTTNKETQTDTIYRQFEADITVLLKNKTIFNRLVDNTFILDYKKQIHNEEITKRLLKSVTINHEKSLHDKVYITLSFCKPNNTNCMLYELIIDKEGNYIVNDVKNDNC